MGKLDALFGGRERELFARFSQMAGLIAQAGETFQTLANDLTNATTHAQRLHEIEHGCDEIVAKIFNLLATTSHFRLEHEDIAALTQKGDDVVDLIWGAANRIVRHDLKDADPELHQVAEIIIAMTEKISEILKNLKRLRGGKELKAVIERFHQEENRADELKYVVSQRRFKAADSVQSLKLAIAWEEVFKHLESTTDRCVDITDIIGHFPKKYGY